MPASRLRNTRRTSVTISLLPLRPREEFQLFSDARDLNYERSGTFFKAEVLHYIRKTLSLVSPIFQVEVQGNPVLQRSDIFQRLKIIATQVCNQGSPVAFLLYVVWLRSESTGQANVRLNISIRLFRLTERPEASFA
jgi:hypothetical protein